MGVCEVNSTCREHLRSFIKDRKITPSARLTFPCGCGDKRIVIIGWC